MPPRLSDDPDGDSHLHEPLLPTSYPPSSPPTSTPPTIPPRPKSRSWIPSSRSLALNSRAGRIALISGLTLLAFLALHGVFRPDYKASAKQVYEWTQGTFGHDSENVPTEGEAGRPYTDPAEPQATPATGIDVGDGIMNSGTPDDDDSLGYAYGAHAEGHEWSIDDLREMVGRTKGYYVRDWSLGLGWNNMRYIIEAALLHAQMLNRTLVLPSFIYARGCEFAHEVCAAYAPQVDRFQEVGWKRNLNGKWEKREVAFEEGLRRREDGQKDHTGWRIPIEYMFDLPHLRSSQPVILVSEYLTLHGMDPAAEWKSGMWGRQAYSNGNTMHMIPNREYDPQSILRVDVLLPEAQAHKTEWTELGQLIQARLQIKKGTSDLGVMEYEDVRGMLRGIEGVDVDDEDRLEQGLREGGLSVLYTFQGSRGIDLIKHVTEPIRQVAPTPMLKGLVDDYSGVDTDVLLLEGEVHLWRKPGSLRFTTDAVRRDFENIVLHSLRPHPRVQEIGDIMARRMAEKAGGRMWLAGHLRRGDFVELGWALEHDIGPHLKIVTDAFERGKEELRQIKANGDAHVAPVPGAILNTTVWTLDLPQQGDSFFLATDERGAEELAYCRSQGALLTPDVISFNDRRMYGWELLFSDIVMLVEQVVMSQAGFFYGYGASSVAGGTLNQRAARGMDPRTGVVA